MSTYTKYRDTAIGTTKARLLKRITHRLRKVIYEEMCQEDATANRQDLWQRAAVRARLQVQKNSPHR